MLKMPLLGNLACILTTVIWHIQRCFRHRKEDSKDCCDTNIESNENVTMSSLACCISESLFDGETTCHLSSAHIWIIKFYKYQVCNYSWILHTKGKGEWCGFLQFPLCISAGIKPFQWGDYWVKQEEGVYSCQVGGSDTTLEKGTGGFGWASSYGPHRKQNLHRLPKQQTPKGVSLPRWKAAPMTPWELSCITSNAHIKTLHPVPKTHLVL